MDQKFYADRSVPKNGLFQYIVWGELIQSKMGQTGPLSLSSFGQVQSNYFTSFEGIDWCMLLQSYSIVNLTFLVCTCTHTHIKPLKRLSQLQHKKILIFFFFYHYYFSRKKDLTFNVNHLLARLGRWFTWNARSYFLWKMKKKKKKNRMSSAANFAWHLKG